MNNENELDAFREYWNQREPKKGDRLMYSLCLQMGGGTYLIAPEEIKSSVIFGRGWTRIKTNEARDEIMSAFRGEPCVYLDFCRRFAGQRVRIPEISEYTPLFTMRELDELREWYAYGE